MLLSCGENIDLEALDSQGRRAIDLCPYSSPIFKTIRDQLRRVAYENCRKKIEECIEDDEKSTNEKFSEGSNVAHSIISSRECIVAPPQRRTIEVMQQLFHLKQLPADQLQQDVPPAPAPFP